MEWLPRMSWRRFQVLVRCLSPNSATMNRLSSGTYIGKEKVNTVAGPKAAEAAFKAKFATPPPSKPQRAKKGS